MFHRFPEVKSPQDSEVLHNENGSRSSTPGIVIDGRTFHSHASPISQQASITAYPIISPSSPVYSRDNQDVVDSGILPTKYLASPPEAHRYMSEAYRLTSEALDQTRFSCDPNRIAVDPYQQNVQTHRLSGDVQRVRIEEIPLESYHRNAEEVYTNNPIDLQRVPDTNIPHLSNANRIELDVHKIEATEPHIINGLRSVPISEDLQRHNITDSTSPNSTSSFAYRTIISEPLRPPSEPLHRTIQVSEGYSRSIQESVLRPHGDLPRMVQESFGREYFTQRQSLENLRSTPELRSDNIHYITTDSMHSGESQRYTLDMIPQRNLIVENIRIGPETNHSLIPENIRIDTETPHPAMAENLRVTPDGAGIGPENLCLTDSVQVMPENLHISHDIRVNDRVNGICNGELSNGPLLNHPQPSESPLQTMRNQYEPSHRIISEPHHLRETIRIQSPHYSDNLYRTDLQTNILSPAPTHNSATTMIDQNNRYYTTYVTQSSHPSMIHNNQVIYMNDICEDGDTSDGLSLEEKIERGYQDIKPFDSNYPVALPVMHMTHQDPLPQAAHIQKPPKPKKTKEPKPPRMPVIHKCADCNRIFKNSTQLKNHMWHHTGEKPFTCEECGSKFTQQGNLRAHRRIHTGEKPYHCSDCQACFTQLSTLKTHQKIHSNERPYKCDRCEAAFRQVANLKTHLVTHTGERPHKCEQCDKAFTQKSNLKAHKNRVHTGEGLSAPAKRGRRKALTAIKPFSCHECGAKFTIVSNLKIHMKLHLGDKTYECDFCGAGFPQRANLKTHIQRMHNKIPGQGRKRIRCDECPAMFRLKRCLKTHKKRRHPIKSLKIKILHQSKYMMDTSSENAAVEEDNEDVEGEDDCGDDCDDLLDPSHVTCGSKCEEDCEISNPTMNDSEREDKSDNSTQLLEFALKKEPREESTPSPYMPDFESQPNTSSQEPNIYIKKEEQLIVPEDDAKHCLDDASLATLSDTNVSQDYVQVEGQESNDVDIPQHNLATESNLPLVNQIS